MTAEVVTVATHKEGLFDKLIHNKFDIQINVLGFGQKWTGFKMKTELVYEHIKGLEDNKIVIYLDGFDSTINGNLTTAISRFKNTRSKVLFSRDVDYPFFGLERFVFPRCKGNMNLNCGMYMGYAKYLKLVLKEVLNQKCKDDQVVVNRLCQKLTFIDVDENESIFKNIYNTRKLDKEIPKSNAVFFSQPGTLSYKRVGRAFLEYGQYFLPILFVIYAVTVYFLYKVRYIYTILAISLLFTVYLLKMDKSCYA